MKIEDIDPYLCTHLIYAFANINTEFKKLASVEWDDLSTDTIIGNYQKFNNLKSINSRLKTLMSIGGAKAGSWPFEQVTKDVHMADLFAKNVVKFLLEHDFNGLDVDWEFPRRADKFTMLMQVEFITFVPTFPIRIPCQYSVLLSTLVETINRTCKYSQSLRDAFKEEKGKSGTVLLLTAAVGVGEKHISYGYNVPHIARSVARGK